MKKYNELLEALWASHIAERQDDAPTVISLFAGCGGSSLGYSAAGFKELCANEWDKSAANTFKLNFKDVPMIVGDVYNLTRASIIEATGLPADFKLTVLDGSPPCQGFSTAGQRKMGDDRNQLFRQYLRLVGELDPDVCILENVKGMVTGPMRGYYNEISKGLDAAGYQVKAMILNAALYQVPQKRQRVIFIAIRKTLGIVPQHPLPHDERFTINDAFENIAQSDSEDIKMLTGKEKACWPTSNVGRAVGSFKSRTKIDRAKCAQTIIAQTNHVHDVEPRFLSMNELKRISSFPDGFLFADKQFDVRLKQIGNSVPPLLMFHIASSIKKQLSQTDGQQPPIIEQP